MQYCNHCKVSIRNPKEQCPLCGNKLAPLDDELEKKEIFPSIPSYLKSHLTLRILILVSIILVVFSFSIYAIFPTKMNWPLLLTFGIVSIWLDLIFLVQKRFHIPKKIVWQVAIISLLSVFWDWKIGWIGWSITYVIPFLCLIGMILMYSIAIIMKLSTRDYITYVFIDALFGIIPIIFILFNLVDVIYPSIISIAISVIFLAAIFILQGKSIISELDKRMHM
ncbi:MAG: DUF6320 domain-containing protein [Clostridiaceae bacterium]